MPMHDTDLRSDAELLGAFLARKDQAAFENVVRRHERLVLNVCARVLNDRQEAHDAAQAVFLTLALKAGDLDLGRPLGPWLHRVAHGTAVNARKARDARRAREREAAMRERSTPDAWESVKGLLDAELDRLPERYRRPLVLFHLEGRSIDETAEALGSAPGTVGSWLSRGRELLRERLVRQGVTALPVALLTALLSGEASAQSVSAGFAAWTARGASLPGGGGCVPLHVLALSKGQVAMMFWTKVKIAALAWTAAAAVAAVGVTALTTSSEAPAKAVVEERTYALAAVPVEEPASAVVVDTPQAEPATGATKVSDLLGWWPLDGNAEDASGNKGHAKVVGEPGKTEGRLKGAYAFDGKGSSYLEVPNSLELDRVEQGSYTLAAWFKAAIVPPGKTDDVNDGAYGIVIKTGWHTGLTFTREGTFLMTHWLAGKEGGDPEWKGIGTWGESYEAGKWYHVAGVVNKSAGSVEIFVNGESVKSEEFEKDRAARPTEGSTWKIGVASPQAEQWAWPANGAVDDVRIYSRALSPMEIKALAELK